VNSNESSQNEVSANVHSHHTLSLPSDVTNVTKVTNVSNVSNGLQAGLIEVLSDHGWAKKSSGLDVLMRAMGSGMKIAVVQLMAGEFSSSEVKFMHRFPNEISFCAVSENPRLDAQNREPICEQTHEQIREHSPAQNDDKLAMCAQEAWQQALLFLRNPNIGLLVLSQLNVAINDGYLNVHHVVQHLLKRPLHQHVVITGREVPPELMEIADVVTELRAMKYSTTLGFE
jgi:cob(I)alamin adenosyltransferase